MDASSFKQTKDVAGEQHVSTRMSLPTKKRSGPDVGFVDQSSTGRPSVQ